MTYYQQKDKTVRAWSRHDVKPQHN